MIMMNSDDRRKGIIVKGIAGFYYVKSGDAVYRCKDAASSNSGISSLL